MSGTKAHTMRSRSTASNGIAEAGVPVSFSPNKRVSVHSQDPGRWNAALGWTGALFGLLIALYMGCWAFDGPFHPPAGFESYDSLPRRLLRLGHIAAVAVGLINVLIGRELARVRLSAGWMKIASTSALLAWPGLALGCMAAAFVPALKYALPLGACALTTAVAIVAAGAWREARKETPDVA